MQPRSFSECPVQNICEFSAVDGPACGSTQEQVSQVLLAEQVCVNALAGYWNPKADRELRPGDPSAEATWKYLSASRNIEIALSPDVSDSTAAERFDAAEADLGYADSRPGRTLDNVLNVRSALNYLPAFRTRRADSDLNPKEIASLSIEVASLMVITQSAPLHKISSTATCTAEHGPCVSSEATRERYKQRLAVQLLCLREDEIAYPALSREANHVKGVEHLEHDEYVLADSDKVPLQLVPEGTDISQRPGDVLPIDYNLLASEAATLLDLRGESVPAKASTRHFRWLIHEAEGERLEESQVRYLDALSELLLRRIDHYTEGFED